MRKMIDSRPEPLDHLVTAYEFHKMPYFSIPFEMAATVYIQAASPPEAQSKLEQVLARGIDARDKRWFSGAPYGVLFFPEFSFATAMTIFKPTSEQFCSPIEMADVNRMMLSREENKKLFILPHSPEWYGEGKTPIFTVDLHVRTTGFVKATSFDEAKAFVAGLDDTDVHWEVAEQWFELDGLQDEFPLILSPNLLISGIAEASKLTMRWPEHRDDFKVAAEINADIEKLAEGFKALEIDALAGRLRAYFKRKGISFSLLSDDDVRQIAGQLVDYRTDKQARTGSPLGTSTSGGFAAT
jgi:hypothetical protein